VRNASRKRGQDAGEVPATGHRCLVDFKAFRVELYFESETSLTYTSIRPDDSRGGSETISVTIEPIRDRQFLVMWQEADKTTVIYLEDYENNTILTNATEPDGKFSNYHGTTTSTS
jgi:hypothetical protein